MPFFRFHFFDGQSPKEIWAPTLSAAQAAVQQEFGSNFSFAGSSENSLANQGYQSLGRADADVAAIAGTRSTGVTGAGGVTGGLESVFPQAAYERGLQRQGQNPEGFLSNYLASLYRPAAATFAINRATGAAPTGDLENLFQESVANTPVGNIRRNATEAFRTLGTQAPASSAQGLQTLAGYADPYGAGPEGAADEDKIQNLIALAGQAAATRYSPFAAQQLLPGGATVRRRYERGGLQGSLYDFLKNQFGLTGGF